MQGQFRKEHRRDAGIAGYVRELAGQGSRWSPAGRESAYLTAKAGGGTVDEIPENAGESACVAAVRHRPYRHVVMVEINCPSKAVVVHHVGVQSAIRTMVDVLEEHAITVARCVMGGASHANPHHGFDCRGMGGRWNGRVRSPFVFAVNQVDCSRLYSR